MVGAALLILSQSTIANASETIDWTEYYAPTVTADEAAQTMTVKNEHVVAQVARDDYTVKLPPPPPPPPQAASRLTATSSERAVNEMRMGRLVQ